MMEPSHKWGSLWSKQLSSFGTGHIILLTILVNILLLSSLVSEGKFFTTVFATLPSLSSSPSKKGLEKELASIAVERHPGASNRKLFGNEAQAVAKEKWIVVTTINPPTEAIQILASFQEWQLVVVADTKTPVDWHVEGVYFLSMEKQRLLKYRMNNLVPEKNYGRKNIGYLFAIQHGAKVVYETDDDNIFIMHQLSQAFDLDVESPTTDILVYNRSQGYNPRNVVNPYIHFGQAGVWPRGYPLDAIAMNAPESSYKVEAIKRARPQIQQGLANGDPDVDAIFRLTRRSSGEKISFEFDSQARPVSIPDHLFCPFNSQNTLFHYEALWGLLLPITTAFRVCDIWRGYFAQRLLWDIGGHLAFYPPSVRQDRNVHDYVLDFMDEEQLYKDGRRLVNFLDNWSSQEPLFFDRVLSLSKDMVRQGFWKLDDARLTASWLSDLLTVGYTEPVIVRSDPQPVKEATGQANEAITVKAMPSSYLKTYESSQSGSNLVRYGGGQECQGSLSDDLDPAFRELAKWRAYFSNVVLIVNYNFVHHQSVPFWRALYSRVFQYIEFVSEEGDPVLGVRKVAGLSGGALFYRALPEIFSLYPDADGFLYSNDDVMLNYWNLYGADKTKIWLPPEHRVMIKLANGTMQYRRNSTAVVERCGTTPDSGWWCLPGFEGMRNAALEAISNMKDGFKKRLADFCGTTASDERAVNSNVDFFYIPQRLVEPLSSLIPIFVEKMAFSELAMPTMLYAVTRTPDDIDTVAFSNVLYLWDGRRDQVEQLYNTGLHALHPWKPKDEQSMGKILSALSQGDPTLLGFDSKPRPSTY